MGRSVGAAVHHHDDAVVEERPGALLAVLHRLQQVRDHLVEPLFQRKLAALGSIAPKSCHVPVYQSEPGG